MPLLGPKMLAEALTGRPELSWYSTLVVEGQPIGSLRGTTTQTSPRGRREEGGTTHFC